MYMITRKPKEKELARSLRKKGLLIKEIADEVGVHKSTVSRWVSDIPGVRHVLENVDEKERTATCSQCGQVKIRKNGPRWLCRSVAKNNYDQNVDKSTKIFYEFLLSKSCIDCGEDNPIVLEFDHIGKKSYNVSDMVRKGYKWETILKEIAECEVVCANCHRIRTNRRGGWFRYVKGN